jgi:hypothetical protein
MGDHRRTILNRLSMTGSQEVRGFESHRLHPLKRSFAIFYGSVESAGTRAEANGYRVMTCGPNESGSSDVSKSRDTNGAGWRAAAAFCALRLVA